MRERTPAHRDLSDDVPEEVKKQRHLLLADAFRKYALEINSAQVRAFCFGFAPSPFK